MRVNVGIDQFSVNVQRSYLYQRISVALWTGNARLMSECSDLLFDRRLIATFDPSGPFIGHGDMIHDDYA